MHKTSLISHFNRNGVTPLHIASGNNHEDIVDILLQNKANPKLRDFNKQTAADFAKQAGHDDIVKKLETHSIPRKASSKDASATPKFTTYHSVLEEKRQTSDSILLLTDKKAGKDLSLKTEAQEASMGLLQSLAQNAANIGRVTRKSAAALIAAVAGKVAMAEVEETPNPNMTPTYVAEVLTGVVVAISATAAIAYGVKKVVDRFSATTTDSDSTHSSSSSVASHKAHSANSGGKKKGGRG